MKVHSSLCDQRHSLEDGVLLQPPHIFAGTQYFAPLLISLILLFFNFPLNFMLCSIIITFLHVPSRRNRLVFNTTTNPDPTIIVIIKEIVLRDSAEGEQKRRVWMDGCCTLSLAPLLLLLDYDDEF